MTRRPRVALAMLAGLALAATACGSSSKKTSSTTAAAGGSATTAAATASCPSSAGKGTGTPKFGLVYDLAGRGDKSFNDAAYAGAACAVKDFGLAAPKELTPSKDEERESRLQALVDEKDDLIFAVGFLFDDSLKKVATANPSSHFAEVDGGVTAPNVELLTFAEEQGSFLVGAAAALQSKSGKIGFIGGVATDLIKKFEAGYKAGAQAAKPGITIDSKYITQPPDFTGFNAPDKGKEIAAKMYSDGDDIVYAAAGGSGLGMFQAAKEASAKGTKVWGIGVDSDQYNTVGADLQPYVMTSMLKRVDVAVYGALKDATNGTYSGGTDRVFDLKVNGVGYSTSGGFLTQDTITKLEGYKADIVSGKITVPTK